MPINLYEPRTLQRVFSEIKPAFSFLRDTFFGGRETSVTELVDVDYVKGKRRLARYSSSKNLRGKEVKRDGFITRTFRPALINPKRTITGETVKQRLPGEHIYAGKTDEDRALEILAKDLDELDQQLTRRGEQQVAEMMFTGKVTMKDDDIDEEFNYEFTNKEILSGSDVWTDDSSDPISELRQRKAAIRQKSGIVPNIVVFSEEAYEAFISNPNVQKAMENRRITRGDIIPRPISDAVDYIGNLSELGLELYVYTDWYVDPVTDAEASMIPAGYYLMGNSNTESYINHGAITFIDPTTKQWTTYVAERVPRRIVNTEDSIEEITLLSRPIPVPENIDSWYVVKVV
jgi:hypothetical protein